MIRISTVMALGDLRSWVGRLSGSIWDTRRSIAARMSWCVERWKLDRSWLSSSFIKDRPSILLNLMDLLTDISRILDITPTNVALHIALYVALNVPAHIHTLHVAPHISHIPQFTGVSKIPRCIHVLRLRLWLRCKSKARRLRLLGLELWRWRNMTGRRRSYRRCSAGRPRRWFVIGRIQQ